MCALRWLVKENEWNKMHTASKLKLKFQIILRSLQSFEVRRHIFCYARTKTMEELAVSTVIAEEDTVWGKTWYRHKERRIGNRAVKSNTVCCIVMPACTVSLFFP